MTASDTTLELSLFGTIAVKIDDAGIEGSLFVKGRLLLAYLAIHSGRPVSTHRITEMGCRGWKAPVFRHGM